MKKRIKILCFMIAVFLMFSTISFTVFAVEDEVITADFVTMEEFIEEDVIGTEPITRDTCVTGGGHDSYLYSAIPSLKATWYGDPSGCIVEWWGITNTILCYRAAIGCKWSNIYTYYEERVKQYHKMGSNGHCLNGCGW